MSPVPRIFPNATLDHLEQRNPGYEMIANTNLRTPTVAVMATGGCLAALVAGAHRGTRDALGMDTDLPMLEMWISSAAAHFGANYLDTVGAPLYERLKSGTLGGAFLPPLAFAAGYVPMYVASKILS